MNLPRNLPAQIQRYSFPNKKINFETLFGLLSGVRPRKNCCLHIQLATYFSCTAFHINKVINTDAKMGSMALIPQQRCGNNSYLQLTVINKHVEDIKPFTRTYINKPSGHWRSSKFCLGRGQIEQRVNLMNYTYNNLCIYRWGEPTLSSMSSIIYIVCKIYTLLDLAPPIQNFGLRQWPEGLLM